MLQFNGLQMLFQVRLTTVHSSDKYGLKIRLFSIKSDFLSSRKKKDSCQNLTFFQTEKPRYRSHCSSYKGLNGTVLNGTMPLYK